MTKKVKKLTGFHYLLIKIQLYTLILLKLGIFVKKYLKKLEINQLLIIYLEDKIMNLLCVDITVSLS